MKTQPRHPDSEKGQTWYQIIKNTGGTRVDVKQHMSKKQRLKVIQETTVSKTTHQRDIHQTIRFYSPI